MIPDLRPYQARAVSSLRRHALQGVRRICLAIPTAGGKTIVASHIIHSGRTNFNARIVFIAPWIQLIEQTVKQLAKWDITDVGVLRADDERTSPDAPVQIASIQTLIRRAMPPADIVLVDECHRSSSDMYKPVFAHYREATIIGLSATPVGLQGVYDTIEVGATYSDLIADKFIAESIVFGAPRDADLSRVRTTGGDFNVGELEAAMLDGALVGDIVESWKLRGGDHRTVIFATGVDHSMALVARFVAAGIPAEHIDASTSVQARAACLRRLEDGHTKVVSNVGVLTEGWDQPSVRCCILARPTKSLALYKQMVGRVLRVWGDVAPIVLDHAGNVDRHGLPHEDIEWTLTEAKRKQRSDIRTCGKCFAFVESKHASCPHCGYVFPVVKREQPREVNAALVVKQASDEKRRFFDAQVERARNRGFKPGFASAKYKEKFGAWPPWAWSQAVKAAFALDGDWQARQERHQRESAYWKEQDAKAKAAMPAADALPENDFEEPEEVSNDFASWLATEGVG